MNYDGCGGHDSALLSKAKGSTKSVEGSILESEIQHDQKSIQRDTFGTGNEPSTRIVLQAFQ